MYMSVGDPGQGPAPPDPTPTGFLDQTEAKRAEKKKCFWDPPDPHPLIGRSGSATAYMHTKVTVTTK